MPTKNEENANSIGQERQHNDATQQYDAEHGAHRDNVEGMPQDDKLPTGELPQAPDPSPFRIGPLGGGADGGR
jgi:hypothetical protein